MTRLIHHRVEFVQRIVLILTLGLCAGHASAQFEWREVAELNDSDEVRDIVASPNGNLFALTSSAQVWSSTDEGETWAELDLTGVQKSATVYQIVSSRTTETLLVVLNEGTFYVYESTDGGDSFAQIAIVPSRPADFYVSPNGTWLISDGPRIIRSDNRGEDWEWVYSSSWPVEKRRFTSGKTDEQIIAYSSGGSEDSNGDIIVSEDDGQTWTPLYPVTPAIRAATLLPNDSLLVSGDGATLTIPLLSQGPQDNWIETGVGRRVQDVVTVPDRELVLLASAGFYASTLPVRRWHREAEIGVAYSLELIETNSELQEFAIIVGTKGFIWKSRVPRRISTQNAAPDDAPRIQLDVYPNPAGELLTIRLSPDFRGPVSLKLIDILGREIHLGIVENGTRGPFERSYSISGLSSGFYILTAEESGTGTRIVQPFHVAH